MTPEKVKAIIALNDEINICKTALQPNPTNYCIVNALIALNLPWRELITDKLDELTTKLTSL